MKYISLNSERLKKENKLEICHKHNSFNVRSTNKAILKPSYFFLILSTASFIPFSLSLSLFIPGVSPATQKSVPSSHLDLLLNTFRALLLNLARDQRTAIKADDLHLAVFVLTSVLSVQWKHQP